MKIEVKIRILLAGILLCCLSTATMAEDSQGNKEHRIPSVEGPIQLDGVLSESFWDSALKLNIGFEVRPGENIEAPVRTDVFIAHTESHLLVGYRAFDPEPDKIRVRYCNRDDLYEDDWVAIIIDSFNDQRRAFDFFCNAYGIQGDATESPMFDAAWDAIWDSAGRVTDEGYEVEMAIPFSSLRFPKSDGELTWGFDLIRRYPRDQRYHLTLFPRDRNNNCYWCQADKMTGFRGVTPGRNLEFDPTMVVIQNQSRDGFPDGDFENDPSQEDLGLTIRWGVTPNISLNATVNPDFSQVEADVQQLEVNQQFALYYPETRPFFMEGADFFNTRINTVYTRSLFNPNAGLKVTGKSGRNAFGLFSVQDDVTNMILPSSQGSSFASIDDTNIGTAFRYRRDIGEASNLGAIISDREGEDYFNRVVGVDGSLRISQRDRIGFQVLGSQTQYPSSLASDYGLSEEQLDGYGVDALYSHDTRGLDYYIVYVDMSPELRTDLGFNPRVNFRGTDFGWGHTWHRGAESWWTQFNVGSGFEYWDEHDGDFLKKGYTFWFDYSGRQQTELHINGIYGSQTYGDKQYDDRRMSLRGSWIPRGNVYFNLEGDYGDRIDYVNARPGRRWRVGPGVSLKVGGHLRLDYFHNFERMAVGGEKLFTAHLGFLRVNYQINRRTSFRAIVQNGFYDYNTSLYVAGWPSEEKVLASQLLFSYTINPQTVLYLGYADGFYGDEDISLTQYQRGVFAKLGYAWVL